MMDTTLATLLTDAVLRAVAVRLFNSDYADQLSDDDCALARRVLLDVLEPWARAQQEQIDRLQSALRDRSTTAEEAIILHWQPALEATEVEIARLRSLLNYALNGWGAHAKKDMEHNEIGRIRDEAREGEREP